MNLMELVIAGIMFVVLGFVLTVGQNITTQNVQSICANIAGGKWNTYVTANTSGEAALSLNPYDKTTTGCCSNNTAYNSSVCYGWVTSNYAINSSYYAMSANNTLAYWLPIISLAMAAGFVIAILITYLLGSVVGKHQAAAI